MRINSLFRRVAASDIDDNDKKQIYKVVRYILKNRKKWDIDNDLSDLFDNWDEISDDIEEKLHGYNRELFEQVFEIDEVVEYLEVHEVDEDEDEDEEKDDLTVIRNIDVKVNMPFSWVFYYLMLVNTAVLGLSAFQVYSKSQ